MKPIPKKLLIHTIMLYEKTSIDKWGSEKLDDGQVLTKVRIEPSNQIVRDKNNSEIQLAATLFYDCRNSQPIGINFNVWESNAKNIWAKKDFVYIGSGA